MAVPDSQRVRKQCERLRAAGLRPVQVLVSDSDPGFVEECRRQSLMVAAADAADSDLDDVMEAALADLWHERNA